MTSEFADDIVELHRLLTSREQPETVAAVILRVAHDELDAQQRRLLGQAARFAERHPLFRSMMATEWEQPVGAAETVQYVAGAFVGIADELAELPHRPDPDQVDAVRAWHQSLATRVGWTSEPSPQNFTRRALWAAGLEVSMRRYRRAWHSLDRLESKLGHLERMQLRRQLAMSARGNLAGTITLEEVAGDPAAASFCAYLIAKKNLRRTFSVAGRDSPFDHIADMLYQRLDGSSDWWMVARAHITEDTVRHLDERQRGHLIAVCWDDMERAVRLCQDVNLASPVDRDTMVVRRGQDSDTWNLAAGAYNTARARWLQVLAASGQLGLLEAVCPPKLPRLMAADLIYWHQIVGNATAHPDVLVAASLPPVWEVLQGQAECTAPMVLQACAAHGLDPEASYWTGPVRPGELGRFEPTPELVHGIVVSSPLLGSILRHARVFSGQPIRWDQLPDIDIQLGRSGPR